MKKITACLGLLCLGLMACKEEVVFIPNLEVENISSGTSNTLWDIHFIDSQTGFIAGEGGVLLKTTNAGQSWSQVDGLILASRLNAIAFPSRDTGYISGPDDFLKTFDGGETWALLGVGFDKIHFPDPNVGYAIRGEDVLKTTNSGQSWNVLHGFPITALQPINIYFITADIGYVADLISLYATADGGTTWFANAAPGWSTAFNFLDTLNGFAINQNGRISLTNDGGANWYDSEGSDFFLRSVFASSESVVYVAGLNTLTVSTDGGNTWTHLRTQDGTSIASDIYDIHFLDDLTGFGVTASGEILKFKRPEN